MKVIVMKKGSLDVTQFTSVSSISYSSGTVTITHGGGTNTYTYADYMVQIIP